MEEQLQNVIRYLIQLDEYKRKQVISILTASMLSELSDAQAREIYNKIIEQFKRAE